MRGNAILHYLKVLINAENPCTQTSEAEKELLIKYCKNALLAVEIGVFEGVNTALIASHISDQGILYGIDPFFKGSFGICYGKLITFLEIKRNGVSDKVKLIEKLSFDAVDDVPNGIDFIFIDGDHSWDGIQRDWDYWSVKVKKQGIIALHDTAVPEFDPSRNLDSIKYFREIIQYDTNYIIKEKADSLHILQKIE